MKYCTRCIIPYNRPNIVFDELGNCNCATQQEKDQIDWVSREQLFRKVVENAKARSQSYDCVIPVSGGKDSTWQVVKCLEYGLRPLAVTWRPPGRTEIGQKNLQNLIQLGVDHIDYQINPTVEKKFTLAALKKFGTPALPMHMAIFNIPVNIAIRLSIPLIVWGENSAFEYGGTDDARYGFVLNAKWRERHGVTHGTIASDWISAELSKKDLAAYFGPSDEELEKAGTLAVFLGYYFRWDPETSRIVAEKNGFLRAKSPRTGFYDFADIDDDFISIHHWMKWYKFGFTRTFDNLSIEIRNGRMPRAEAIEILRSRGDETPHEDIQKFCQWIGISVDEFFQIAETFRNTNVWEKQDGRWMIRDFIIDSWSWT